MISLSDKLNAINALIALVLIVACLYGPMQQLLVDVVRQKLFELRDELFDLARSGEITFDSESYVAVRGFLNGTIRFADRFSALRLLLFVPVMRDMKVSPMQVVLERASCDEIRAKLTKINRRASMLVVALMWLRSPLLILLSAVVIVFAPIIGTAVALSQTLRRRVRRFGTAVRRQIETEACLEQQ